MNDIGVPLQLGFTLLLLWTLYYIGIRQYRIDRLRNELFELRNELFLYAADGNIGFDSYAYNVLRSRINALARYTHLITFTRIALFDGVKNPRLEQENNRFVSEIQKMPTAQQQRILGIQNRVYVAIAKHMLFSAPPLLILAFGYLALKRIATLLSPRPLDAFAINASGAVRKLHVDVIQQQAMDAQRNEVQGREPELMHA